MKNLCFSMLTHGVWAIAVLASFIPARAADHITQALSDVRVLYLFDDPRQIDWATIYYLNDARSCAVDLVTVKPADAFRLEHARIDGRQLALHTAYLNTEDAGYPAKLFDRLFDERRPDLIISGDFPAGSPARACESYLLDLPPVAGSLFNIKKIYRRQDALQTAASDERATVVNSEELFRQYEDRMQLEIPRMLSEMSLDAYRPERLTRYRLIRNNVDGQAASSDFLSGFVSLRLIPVIDSIVRVPSAKESLLRHARNFVSVFALAENSTGPDRVENLVVGYKELLSLERQIEAQYSMSSMPEFKSYLESLSGRAQEAVLDEIGINWEGAIIVRDSPHGLRLKFRASLAVDGPEEVELAYVHFLPYWDTTTVVLDSVSHEVPPHQSFVREYLVDIDPARLASELPEYLKFSAEIVYSQIQMPVVSSVPVREMPRLSIAFQPDFHFVPPVARVDVDRVVASMNWNAVITKPESYFANAIVRLETPRGVFAGAYRTDLELARGLTTETIRIPFSVSNLFEMGIQPQTISLMVDGRTVSADTGIIRIAACPVADTIKIGFLPDSSGMIEDILRMTDAGFQPLTDRGLITGDLEAYNVILIGSGAFRNYPSLVRAKGRFEEYLRHGGSLVILGQPAEWPDGVLPVLITPSRERLSTADITVRLPQARILSQPNAIDQAALLSYFGRSPVSAPALVAPSERVLTAPSESTLLSVSRLGDGQIIYCGLPLAEMVAALNLEAIHLFSNILNY